MRKRLRPAYSPLILSAMYSRPHDHTRWPDHVERVRETIDVAKVFDATPAIADLSCGDAAIAHALAVRHYDETGQVAALQLGDLAPGYPLCGPIEATIVLIEDVDLFICCETIEHIDDPEALLQAIRGRSRQLLLSTPLGDTADNPEHYWSWDENAVREMLLGAGWAPLDYREVRHPLAAYQIWACT